jgi:hypothetical protein
MTVTGAAPEMIGIADGGETTVMGAAPEVIGIAEEETITITTTLATRPVTVVVR